MAAFVPEQRNRILFSSLNLPKQSPFLCALLKTTASNSAHPQQPSEVVPWAGHVPALCVSKTTSHPQFAHVPLQLQVSVWKLL